MDSVNRMGTWVNLTAAEVQRQIKIFDPDCLLTASTPFEAHLVGLTVKERTGLPWVASFSDPWPAAILPSPYNATKMPLLWQVQKRLLRQVLEGCDMIHMPSSYGIEWTENAVGLSIKNKAAAIPHIGSFCRTTNTTIHHTGWIAHVGFLSRERVSEALLAGIYKAHQEIPNQFSGLMCVGNVCPEFREKIRHMGMENIVKMTGHVSEDSAIQMSQSFLALLVIEADMAESSPYLPSKFADYAFTGRPIIALTPPISAIRDYLENYGGGTTVQRNSDEISKALIRLFSGNINSRKMVDNNPSPLAQVFSSAVVGKQYQDMFSKIQSCQHSETRQTS